MSTETELLPLEGSKSSVWKHFGFPFKDGQIIEKDKKKRKDVTCRLCFRAIKYSGNTTNLRFHLKEHHRSVFQSLPTDDKAVKSSEGACSGQSTIYQTLAMKERIHQSSPRWSRLTDSVCYFIAEDMQPLDTVDDHGFRHLVHTFEPRYDPPSRKSLTTKYLPQMFEGEKSKVKRHLSSSRRFALTTDIWTSRANQAYTGVTIHFIDTEFELRHFLLETKEFPESHTAGNIADELREILKEWDLNDEFVSAITTDNGRNISAAIRELGWRNLACFSHTLQLGIEKVIKLPQVVKALARCKRIATHFHHSSKSSYILKNKQKSLGHKEHTVIQDVATRWNSSYYMASHILEQQQPLCATLLEVRKTEFMPSDSEFQTLEEFVSVMKPLVDITEAIGSETWITVSTLRPSLNKLMKNHSVPALDDSQLVKTMKTALLQDLQDRYTGETLQLLTKASFLDPRFKNLKFLSDSDRKAAISDLQMDVYLVFDVVNDPSKEPPPNRPKGMHKLLEFIGDEDMECNSERETSLDNVLEIEISQSKGEESTNEAPILWWATNKGRYPLLSQLAAHYLAIPATSVPCERVFSTAGNVVNDKRACLLPRNVNMLVFLAENLD